MCWCLVSDRPVMCPHLPHGHTHTHTLINVFCIYTQDALGLRSLKGKQSFSWTPQNNKCSLLFSSPALSFNYWPLDPVWMYQHAPLTILHNPFMNKHFTVVPWPLRTLLVQVVINIHLVFACSWCCLWPSKHDEPSTIRNWTQIIWQR